MRAQLIVAAVVGLIIGHAAILYFFSTHLTASAAVLSGTAVLLILKHAGLFGTLYARFRRRSRP